jgi:hypothetical protein
VRDYLLHRCIRDSARSIDQHPSIDDGRPLLPLRALATALADPAPWLSPYLPLLQRIVAGTETSSVAAALNAAHTREQDAIFFIDHATLASDEAYESFIFRTGSVPTRDNLHDLFNGVVWLEFPATKRRLNTLQAGQIARSGTAGPRGALRDALTLFDENAALLCAPPVLVDALRVRDWHTAFVTRRAEWQATRCVLFGHALLEKLMAPRKAITAHVWVVPALDDASISASIDPESFTTQRFLPLPVLGVPGWWPANERTDFYEDAHVFRTRNNRA